MDIFLTILSFPFWFFGILFAVLFLHPKAEFTKSKISEVTGEKVKYQVKDEERTFAKCFLFLLSFFCLTIAYILV